jgi:hypothetical protein
MKFVLLTLAIIAVQFAGLSRSTRAADAPAPVKEKDQATLEKEFTALLTGATLVGSYSSSDSPEIKKDRYEIIKIVKAKGDEWIITAKVEYKGFAVPMDMNFPVKWAGDTPVICVTNQKIPGFGTFNARVLFYDNQYVGTWSSAKHGGQMWGRIERTPATQPAK